MALIGVIFLADVKVQGSGKGEDGKYISYYGGKYSYRKPTTATGTEPKVGQTIAVDSYYIPVSSVMVLTTEDTLQSRAGSATELLRIAAAAL